MNYALLYAIGVGVAFVLVLADAIKNRKKILDKIEEDTIEIKAPRQRLVNITAHILAFSVMASWLLVIWYIIDAMTSRSKA